MAHGLADYLDGYEEFFDAHDRRALGLAPLAPAPQYANTTRAPQAFVAASAPLQRAVPMLVPGAQMYAQPAQYAAGAPNPVRLRAALIPTGRTLQIPFAQSGATILNPGDPVTGSPAAMPMAPTTYSVPTSGDAPAIVPDQTGSTPSSAAPQQYLQTQQAQWTQPSGQDGGASSASGTSGISTSTFGWIALAVGAYWMWKNVRED